MPERLPWALLGYMLGILAIFYFKFNSVWLAGLIGISGCILFMTRHKLILSWMSLLIFSFLLGLGNMSLHIYLNRHPVLTSPLYQARITATVLENQPLLDKQILTLGQIYWTNPDLKRPQKIKVHFKKIEPMLYAGDEVKAVVSVYPPDTDFSPAYTYQLWFSGVGATGIADEIQVLKPHHSSSFLGKMRHFINQHLFQILPYSQAEITAPLITGEQKLVSPQTYQLYRRAGIAHVLSVSGFHMALLASFLFFLIQSVCALFPRIALYYNTKKISAVVAFIGTFFYLALSGFQIPAMRAFLMIVFVFLGVLIERSVLSMRSLILIAFFLLLVKPFMLLSISFQLSFMAVAVLVTFCRYLSESSWGKVIKTVVGFVGLNLLITGALTPFILYHFHQLMPYGILGNMLFSGTFSFFIMPLLFIGTLLMPLGWEVPFFRLAGMGLDFVRWGTEKLAYLPYSEITFTSFSSVGLCFVSFGILMICWMRTPLRWAGLLLILMGTLLGILT